MASILIVEDDARLAALLAELLGGAGHDVAIEARGDVGAERIVAEGPDLVLLDINLPGKDGHTVCREVRGRFSGLLLMLTARGEDIDEILGLELGADDYLRKPVNPRTLLARVKALLRRGPTAPSSAVIVNGPLRIDPSRRSVELDGAPISLSTAEFELLLILGRSLGQVMSREAISQALHGRGYDGIDRSIDLRISRLRKALGDPPRAPRWIKTVHGAGYQLARA